MMLKTFLWGGRSRDKTLLDVAGKLDEVDDLQLVRRCRPRRKMERGKDDG